MTDLMMFLPGLGCMPDCFDLSRLDVGADVAVADFSAEVRGLGGHADRLDLDGYDRVLDNPDELLRPDQPTGEGVDAVSDLHTRLLTKVTEAKASPPPCSCGTCPNDMAVVAAADALLVSLELHRPYESWPSRALVCNACLDRGGPYPCHTVRAIARALDVPIGEID